MSIEEKRKSMVKNLNELLNQQPFDIEKYLSKKTEYAVFCYENNLPTFSRDLNESLLEQLFIIPSEPIKYSIDEEIKCRALNKIKDSSPLTAEEIQTILESVVQVARNKLEKERGSLENNSLSGACGLGQGLTYFPLEKIGVGTTINNISHFPDTRYRHAFLTCFFKTIEDGQPVNKQYLIDTTYRQFFTYERCNESAFYTVDSYSKDETAPDAGYFLTQFEDGREFSKKLLKQGYIELTEENARLYGLGFSCESLSFNNRERANTIISHTGEEYLEAINNPILQEEIDYDYEELYAPGELQAIYNSTDKSKK